jgi:hypothetical protein
MSAPVQAGNSGGPLLDQNGNLVGVVTAKLNALKFKRDFPQNVNFAVKTLTCRSTEDCKTANALIAERSALHAQAENRRHERNIRTSPNCSRPIDTSVQNAAQISTPKFETVSSSNLVKSTGRGQNSFEVPRC